MSHPAGPRAPFPAAGGGASGARGPLGGERAGDARGGPEPRGGRTEPDLRPAVVGVVMGSDSDLPVLQKCLDLLDQFDVPYDVNVLSAHRTPEKAHEYASTARLRGLRILIAAAGGAAHLAGVMASLTTLPVIGVPMPTASLGGADSLYSTVQMPAGVPVATVAIGEAGAANAALLAAEILALHDDDMLHRLQAYRAELRRRIAEKNERLRETLAESR
jgi:5-(carboxyamino)imidazole ribonucleotide mutase